MPFIAQVAVGRRPELSIFGDDYPTEDGTCVRDYLHVMDLAAGHVASLESLEQTGVHIFNLGTGLGVSVLEMVKTFEWVTGQRVPYRIAPGARVTLPPFGPMPARPSSSWAGGPSAGSRRCCAIPGACRSETHRAMAQVERWSDNVV